MAHWRGALGLIGVVTISGLSMLGLPAHASAQAWPHAGRRAPNPGPDPTDHLSRVEDIFKSFDRPGRPGLAVAVLKDGETLFSRGYGLAQLEYDIPITPGTVFHVASVSKQFTAFAIATLAQRGELALTDDIRRHLPELPDFGERITIRDLIHHTSGLRDQWTLLTMAGWRLDDVITQADILRLLKRQRELNFSPGSEHVYSNSGYTLLAEIVGVVTGVPFADWMQKEVFGPLGMTDTHFHDDHRTVVKDRAYSYEREPGGKYRRAVLNYANVGATSLFTTTEDLVRWAESFWAPAEGSEAVIRQMTETGILTSGERLAYAFGLTVSERDGRRLVEHSGGDAGFRSHILMAPEERLAVIVLANEARVSPGELSRRVAELFAPETQVAAWGADDGSTGENVARREDVEEVGDSAETVKAAEVDLERVSGLYWNPARDNLRRVYQKRGRLFYNRGASNESELAPLGEDRFRMLGVDVPLLVWFEPRGSNPERMVVRIDDGEPIVSERVEPPPELLDPSPYAGTYVSDELAATYRLLVEGEGLVLRHWRHGDIPLRPVALDRFQSDAWWLGSVRFERDERGRITGFRSSSGRVRHLWFERRDSMPPPAGVVPPSAGVVPPSEGPAER
jgi:CubicO group peptidase (beta-lactamase class C family)